MRKLYFYLMYFGYVRFCEFNQPKRLKTRKTRLEAKRILNVRRLCLLDNMALELKNQIMKLPK